MIDDPLSLLSLGIWLMAAGMWPVGFLFGACSKCCDEECPDECACYFNEYKDFQCRPITCFPNLAKTVSIDSLSVSDVTTLDTNFIEIGFAPVSISGEIGDEPETITFIYYDYIMTNAGQPVCPGRAETECQHFITFRAFPNSPGGVTHFESPPMLLFTSGECAPLSLDKNFEDIEWTLKFGNDDSIWDNMKAYLETLTPNVLLSYDACPQDCKCNKCSQAYESVENGSCNELPDSVVATSDYASKSYTADENKSFSTTGVQHLQLTDTFPCLDGTELYLALNPQFYSLAGRQGDCGCRICVYELAYQLDIAERGVFGGQPFDIVFDPVEQPRILFEYDKCEMTTKQIEIAVTPATIMGIFEGRGGNEFEPACPGVSEFFDDIEEFIFTLDYNLDDPCECGACCRSGSCAENELQTYCEQNSVFFGELEDGTWQGVGTFCGCPDNPNPCDE